MKRNCFSSLTALLLVALVLPAASFAATITPAVPSTDENGCYQIGSAEELYGFAELVNNGNSDINAKLTADIVVNENVLDANGDVNAGDFTQWTPIGDFVYTTYSGMFDGQGHTISGLYVSSSEGHVGFIGCVTGSAVIKNLGIVDSYFSSSGNFLGSIVGCVNDVKSSVTLANVYSISTVKGNNWIGGLVGGNGQGNVSILNSYFAGKTSATFGSGTYSTHHDDLVAGAYDSPISGSLNVLNTFVLGTSIYGASVTSEQLSDGSVAAALHYYQDALADGSIFGLSDNKITFSGSLEGVNTTTANVILHTFDGDTITYTSNYIIGNITPLPITVVRDGYKFAGWYDNADFEGDAVTNISLSENGDMEFWAKFEKKSSVIFVLNGGRINKGEIDYYIEGWITALPAVVLKEDASFDGWYMTEDFSGDRYVAIPSTATGDMTFYAKWSEKRTEFLLMKGLEQEKIFYEGENLVYFDAPMSPMSQLLRIRRENVGYWGESSGFVNVPYAGREGTFGSGGTYVGIPQSGLYVATFIDRGEGKWFVSILRFVGNDALADIPSQIYTGLEIEPEIIVTDGETTLVPGSDYTVTYTDNTNVGTATINISGKGNYGGSVEKKFSIVKATPTVEPPTSANPKYAGTCVALVTAGSTNFGTMLYSVLREGGSQTAYSTDIPCADRAGRYTVYYKVEENDNWSSVEGSVDVSVVNEEFTVTFVDAEGETISSDKYPYGTLVKDIVTPENPEKADDEMYAYTFAGWSPEIQEVTDAKTYSPIYNKTRIGFGPITIAKDSSSAIIDGMSRDPIDKAIKDCMIKGEVTLYRHFAAGKYSTLVLPFSTFTGAFSGVSFYSFRGVEKENGVWKTVVFGYVDKENEGNKRIEANTPYIVVADADMDDLVVKDGVLFNADDPKSSYGATLTCSEETCDEVPDENKSWQFVGTYNYRQWDSGNNVEEIGTTYGFAGAAGNGGMEIGKFGKIKEGAYIYPMRAYLRYQPPSPPSVLFKAAPAYASVASIDELPESMDVVIRGEEGTTVIGTINTRTGEFRSADNRWFDLNGRYLGNKKPTIKGTYYNNGKKVIVK